MELSDFDFDLPDELIALRPASPRSAARLLVATGDAVTDRAVADLPDVLRPGDRLVLNDTRVRAARLTGRRHREVAGAAAGTPGGVASARIEAVLLGPRADGSWSALVKPLRKLRTGERIEFPGGLTAEFLGRDGADLAVLGLSLAGPALEAALEATGAMPLPPYIAGRRVADDRDRTDYQTVFATRPGAVAAPTASLHFDDALLAALTLRGVEFTRVTLHVGAGTFLPVKVADPRQHRMHSEWGQVDEAAAAEIAATRAAGGRIVPVGTTALRLIETAARASGRVEPWSGETDIFIYPGFDFRATDALMTNFHLPRSTLMMLVAAWMGQARMRAIYAHAIAARYRFFSYGDSSLLIPPPR